MGGVGDGDGVPSGCFSSLYLLLCDSCEDCEGGRGGNGLSVIRGSS